MNNCDKFGQLVTSQIQLRINIVMDKLTKSKALNQIMISIGGNTSTHNITKQLPGLGVYSPNNNTQISCRLPCYQNILRVELSAILIAIKTIQTNQIDMHIFTYNLKII